MKDLETTENLFDYFHEHVEEARDGLGVDITDETSLYLVQLLTDRGRADQYIATETTLAELHGRAANSPPAQQARTYRELGDTALYLVGFFEESVQRRIVTPDYYKNMGSAAYYRVDQVLKRWFADAFGPVFHELALGFEDCARLLTAVRDAHLADQPAEVVSLYERWLLNGDAETASRLRAAGLVLPDGLAEA